MRLRLPGLELDLDAALEPAPALRRKVAARLGVPADAVGEVAIVRRSLDARGRRRPRYVFTVEAEVAPVPPALPPGVTEARAAPAIVRPPCASTGRPR